MNAYTSEVIDPFAEIVVAFFMGDDIVREPCFRTGLPASLM
jgi:hypothetical protein